MPVRSKGYLYNLGRFDYLEHEVTSIEFVSIVNKFQDVFPEDLTGIPLEIDLDPNTKPISIPPYRMAPAELKE